MNSFTKMLLNLFKSDCVMSGEKWATSTIAERQRINKWIAVEKEMIMERLT